MAWIFSTAALTSPDELLSDEEVPAELPAELDEVEGKLRRWCSLAAKDPSEALSRAFNGDESARD